LQEFRMPVVAVVGAGHCDLRTAAIAEEVGHKLAQRGITIICGGLGGVMEAACRGAKAAKGLTIAILPGTDPSTANSWVDVAIATGMGEARNVIIVRSAQVLIAVDGEYGTLSEIAFALKLGIPVIGLNTWQLAQQGQFVGAILEVQTPLQAVEAALRQLQRSG
jgi:uncharacterized protein (TIGR00725 family)